MSRSGSYELEKIVTTVSNKKMQPKERWHGEEQ